MRILTNYRPNPWNLFNNEIFNLVHDLTDQNKEPIKTVRSDFPKCDIEETEKNFMLSFDLPGIKKEDLSIEVKKGTLTLSGERKTGPNKNDYSERFFGNFQRDFSLPEQIKSDSIEAHFENGVLQITLPKAETLTSRKIEIGNGIGNNIESSFEKITGVLKNGESAA